MGNKIFQKKGFSGLEAAIVLIAFVIVAAVFSYIILNLGFMTSAKSKEVVHRGTTRALSSLQLQGSVIGIGKTVIPYYWEGYYVDLDGGGWDKFNKCSTGANCSCFYKDDGSISTECAYNLNGYRTWELNSSGTAIECDNTNPIWVWNSINHCIDPNSTDTVDEWYVDLDGIENGGTVGPDKFTYYGSTCDAGEENCGTIFNGTVYKSAKMNKTAWKYWIITNTGSEMDCSATKTETSWAGLCTVGCDTVKHLDDCTPTKKLVQVKLYLEISPGGSPVDFTPNQTLVSYTYLSGGTHYSNIYYSLNQLEFVGENDGNNLLDPFEKILLALGGLNQLKSLENNGSYIAVNPNEQFSIEIKPPKGTSIGIERTVPPQIKGVMDLT
jgi:flagellin-like protein